MQLAALQSLLTSNLRNVDKLVPSILKDQVYKNRIPVYRGNVMGAQLHRLQDTFPICEHILGKEFFERSLRDYVLQHPAIGFHIDDAKAFPPWLTHFIEQHTNMQGYEYLADLARLELAIHHAWYADNTAGFDFNLFAEKSEQFSAEKLILCPNPSLGVIESPWPIDKMWTAQQHQESDIVEAEATTIYLVVLRKHATIIQQRISQGQHTLLKAVQNRMSLQQLSNVQKPTEISKLIQSGAISSFLVEN